MTHPVVIQFLAKKWKQKLGEMSEQTSKFQTEMKEHIDWFEQEKEKDKIEHQKALAQMQAEFQQRSGELQDMLSNLEIQERNIEQVYQQKKIKTKGMSFMSVKK